MRRAVPSRLLTHATSLESALDTQAENLTLQVHNVSLQALIEN